MQYFGSEVKNNYVSRLAWMFKYYASRKDLFWAPATPRERRIIDKILRLDQSIANPVCKMMNAERGSCHATSNQCNTCGRNLSTILRVSVGVEACQNLVGSIEKLEEPQLKS